MITARLVSARLAVAGLAAALLAVPSAPASASDLVYFADSSGSVVCLIAPADEYQYQGEIRCDLLGAAPAATPLPPRPADCPVDWAATAHLREDERARWGACVGDSIGGGDELPAGSVVVAGGFRCTVLEVGVSCRDTDTRYGFRLTPDAMTLLRPKAVSLLSTSGLGKLRIGMTKAQGRRTGYLGDAVCGSPQLKRGMHLRAYLTWRDGRFDGLLANWQTNLQSREGVGVGSTYGAVRRAHEGRLVATTDHVEGERAYVYRVRGKRGSMIFILDTPSTRRPVAMDAVGAIWLTRRWNPRSGFGFSGC